MNTNTLFINTQKQLNNIYKISNHFSRTCDFKNNSHKSDFSKILKESKDTKLLEEEKESLRKIFFVMLEKELYSYSILNINEIAKNLLKENLLFYFIEQNGFLYEWKQEKNELIIFCDIHKKISFSTYNLKLADLILCRCIQGELKKFQEQLSCFDEPIYISNIENLYPCFYHTGFLWEWCGYNDIIYKRENLNIYTFIKKRDE